MKKRTPALWPVTLMLAGCATQVPPHLQPAGERALFTLHAIGVQIYECRVKAGAPGEHEWAFVAPEADLFDRSGRRVGRHYAGPHWEAADGSKVLASMRARADAPSPDTIPWLLLSAKAAGSPEGAFSRVTSIQRLNTVSGAAPKSGCTQATAGTQARVFYTADYVLFTG
ncbi:MAG TPA: DUF3455 domain-containing protein [Ramlibacter sp.]|nr:DUF3455 domain-containing protein [Ramlibacter sp.]